MHPEALKTSPPDVRIAVPQERMRRRVLEKCSLLFALSAVRIARFPSSPPKVRLFSVASALLQRELKESKQPFEEQKSRAKVRLFCSFLKNTIYKKKNSCYNKRCIL